MSPQMKAFFKRLKFRLKEPICTSVSGFRLWAAFSPWKHVVVRKDSVVCIEGFPRSANTFAVAAFILSQGGSELHIARHTHLSGQVKLACRYKVPVLLVIREPRAAVCSLRIFNPDLPVTDTLKAYIRFHKELLPYRSQISVIRFEEVTGDYQKAIDALNVKSGTSFKPVEHTSDFESRCFDLVEKMDRRAMKSPTTSESTVARPSESRKKAREAAEAELCHQGMVRLLARANSIYKDFILS